MISILLWKEYREHRAVWAVLAALAAGVLVGVPAAFPQDFVAPQTRDGVSAIGIILAWAYGIVCGAMLLAGEREAGTQTFLDTLPGTRLRLWLAKCAVGLLFVLAHACVIAGLIVGGSLVEPANWAETGVTLVIAALVGFGWGMLLSAWAGSVLGAVGMAIAAQLMGLQVVALAAMVVAFSAYLVGVILPPILVYPLGILLYLLVPLPLSALVYSREDRQRRHQTRQKLFLRDLRLQFRVSMGLAVRQSRMLALGVLIGSLAAGCLCLPSTLVTWPLFTLTIGVVCGVGTFFDEQTGPRRFLGDQRFPVTPIWTSKVLLRLVLLFAALCLALCPLGVALIIDLGQHAYQPGHGESLASRLFRSGLVGVSLSGSTFFLVPALYGFSISLVCGLLFRKAFVAAVAGLGLALILMGVWAPGLLAGGLPEWQLFVIPALCLIASRLLMRPWSAERLASGPVILGILGLVGLCLAVCGYGIWDRVASVPDLAEPATLQALLDRLPDPEENEAGRLVRGALSQLSAKESIWGAEKPSRPLVPRPEPAAKGDLSYDIQSMEVIRNGWPDQPKAGDELAGWLDKVFADELWKRLAALPQLPIGVVEDPRRLTVQSPFRNLELARTAIRLLLARGLMMQQKGDPSVFVEHLNIACALVSNMDNAAPQIGAYFAMGREETLWLALDQWLRQLPNEPKLLRRTKDILARYQEAQELTARGHDLSEYLIARNSLDDPTPWLREALESVRRPDESELETSLLAAVFRIPWERERQLRLLRQQAFGTTSSTSPRPRYLDLVIPYRHNARWSLEMPRRQFGLQVARLKVALRLYQAQTGRPAAALAQLVPDLLPGVPLNPHDGKPFHYRLSKGEEVRAVEGANFLQLAGQAAAPMGGMPASPLVGEQARLHKIPPGQGILWTDSTPERLILVPMPRLPGGK